MIYQIYLYNISLTFEIIFFCLLLFLLLQKTGFSITTPLASFYSIKLVNQTVLYIIYFFELYFIIFICKLYFINIIFILFDYCVNYIYLFNINYLILCCFVFLKSVFSPLLFLNSIILHANIINIWWAFTIFQYFIICTWKWLAYLSYFLFFIIINILISSLNWLLTLKTYYHSLFYLSNINPIFLSNYQTIIDFTYNLVLRMGPKIVAQADITIPLRSANKTSIITFINPQLNANLEIYNLFHYDVFTLYNKYLIILFVILYYIIIYCYYLIPQVLNIQFVNTKFNLIFKYEYPILVGFLLIGYLLVVNSNNLFIVYLGFEIQTFIILILSGQFRQFLTCITSSLKYFFFSLLSSLFFLLSLLYIYNSTGTLNFYELNYILLYSWTFNLPGMLLFIGIACLLFSFFFKLGVFPFYIWILDIFEGFPRLITLLLLTLNKFNLYIFLIKFLSILTTFNILLLNLILHILTIISLMSLLLGSLLAISQTNIHRFFAATSITHMGFLLLGLKINLYLINYEKTNSYMILYSYFILYLIQTLFIFFILIYWSGLLNSYINQILLNIQKLNLFANFNFNFIKDFMWFNFFSKRTLLILILLLFNLSGFPPFSFFFIKLNLILLLLFNYAYFDLVLSLYFSIIITGSYIRLISLIYIENTFLNLKNKLYFKYLYQLIFNSPYQVDKFKVATFQFEYLLSLITPLILFYNYFIWLL